MIGPQLPAGWQQRQQAQHEQAQEHEDQAVPDASMPITPVTELSSFFKTPMGAGLLNLGNSCFMNSVLQCLAYVPPLSQAVVQRKLHGFQQPCPLHHRGLRCAACLIEQQLASQPGSQRAGRPDGVHANLQLLSKAFIRGRQEDAHEFLLAVLDAVERDSRRGLTALGCPKSVRTLMEALFCGRLVSAVTCLECGHVSCSYEVLTSLSLDVGPRVASVADSLNQFSTAELLDGANKYKCDKCKRLVRARKSLHVHEEPNVLVIHLKRFNSLLPMTAKINRHVAFGLSLKLQLHQHAHGGQPQQHRPPPGYTLTGVVVHQGGSVHSGHYFAYVRDSMGNWYCANDSSVYKVRTEQVFQQQAYLLFYSRNTIKPLGPHPVPAAPPASPSAATAPLPSPEKALVANGHSHVQHPAAAGLRAPGVQQPPVQVQAGKLQAPHVATQLGTTVGNGVSNRAPRIIQLGAARSTVTLAPKVAPKHVPITAPKLKQQQLVQQQAPGAQGLPSASDGPSSATTNLGSGHASNMVDHAGHSNGHAEVSKARQPDGKERHENGHAVSGNGVLGNPRHDKQHDQHQVHHRDVGPSKLRGKYERQPFKGGDSAADRPGNSTLGKHPRSSELPLELQPGSSALADTPPGELRSLHAEQHPGLVGEACRSVKRQALEYARSNPAVMNALRAAMMESLDQGLTLEQVLQQDNLRLSARQLFRQQGAAKFAAWATELKQAVVQTQP